MGAIRKRERQRDHTIHLDLHLPRGRHRVNGCKVQQTYMPLFYKIETGEGDAVGGGVGAGEETL